MQDAHHSEDAANTETYRDEVVTRLAAMEAKLDALTKDRGR
jgi:voltage-gated sodium channel